MSALGGAGSPARAGLAVSLLAGALALEFLLATLFVTLAGTGELSAERSLPAALERLWMDRGDPKVQLWLQRGALLGLLLTGATALQFVKDGPPLHGAARFASPGEVKAAGLAAPTGVLLGRQGGRLLCFGGEEHVALYAPTRSGKGVGVVIPNLLSWPGSVVVLDMKQENWRACAGFRASCGHRMFLFDPLDAEGRTARYNPLGHIDRTSPEAVIEELQRIAVMLFPTSPDADPFWSEAARTGFIGVGALIAASSELPFSLGQIYEAVTLGDPRQRLPQILKERALQGRAVSRACAAAISDFCSASENTFASIKQTMTARLSLWLNPKVRAATEASDFDLRDLRREPMGVFLGTSPENISRLAPLYNLIFQQLIDLNTRAVPEPGSRQVLVLLDEFARLGRAEVLARAFAYVAGYGLRLLCVLQSPAQLRSAYGPYLAEEILTNCGVEATFAPKDLRTAQELSERLGQRTVKAVTRSRPTLFSGGTRSLSESPQRRALLLPQELTLLRQDQLILLRGGIAPVLGRKIVYWRDRAFARRVRPPPPVQPLPRKAESAPVEPSAASSAAPAGLAKEAEATAFIKAFVQADAERARSAPGR